MSVAKSAIAGAMSHEDATSLDSLFPGLEGVERWDAMLQRYADEEPEDGNCPLFDENGQPAIMVCDGNERSNNSHIHGLAEIFASKGVRFKDKPLLQWSPGRKLPMRAVTWGNRTKGMLLMVKLFPNNKFAKKLMEEGIPCERISAKTHQVAIHWMRMFDNDFGNAMEESTFEWMTYLNGLRPSYNLWTKSHPTADRVEQRKFQLQYYLKHSSESCRAFCKRIKKCSSKTECPDNAARTDNLFDNKDAVWTLYDWDTLNMLVVTASDLESWGVLAMCKKYYDDVVDHDDKDADHRTQTELAHLMHEIKKLCMDSAGDCKVRGASKMTMRMRAAFMDSLFPSCSEGACFILQLSWHSSTMPKVLRQRQATMAQAML